MVTLLALLLILAPMLGPYAMSIQTNVSANFESAMHLGGYKNNATKGSDSQSSMLQDPRISRATFPQDRCDEGLDENARCNLCLCINAGVINVNLAIENIPYQAIISTDLINTPYHIHIVPPLRPPIS